MERRALITGDFVLIDKEVNPVAKALRQDGVDVIWANDEPVKLAQALRAALDGTNSRKP